MTDFGAAILEGLQQINGRLERIEARQMATDARQMSMDARLASMEADLKDLRASHTAVEADLRRLRGLFEALPDFRLMMVRSEVTLKKMNDVQHELIDLRARLSEVHKSTVRWQPTRRSIFSARR